MKKFLLTCSLALGLGANAQIFVSESFETAAYTANGFVFTGGYSPNTYLAGCDGTIAIGSNLYGTNVAYNTSTLVYTKPASVTANGKKIDVSFTVSALPYATGSTTNGNLNVAYSTDGGTTYVPFGTTYTFPSTGVTCYAYSAQIPESANVNGNFKLKITSVTVNGATDDFYIFLDKVVVKQEATAAPACTALTSPASAATGVSVRPTLTWAAASGAQSYTVKLGTTPGASDVLSTTVNTTSYTPLSTSALPQNKLLYATVTATNDIGSATGCTETTFTTGANAIAPYCGPMISTAPTQTAPIKSFIFGGVTNTSDAAATTIGSFAPHENYLSAPFEVKNNVTTVPFTVNGIGITGNGWGTSIFIDWNNDGDFLDAGESYFNTTATIKRTTTVSAANIATLTGNITIPAGVTLGQKRMRVKYNFTGTTIHSSLTTGCTDINNGQVEDYTIDYKDFLAVTDVNKAAVSVYPNPFTDVLKISDVKGVKSVSVNDMSGRQVKSLAPSAEINLSSLKGGLYIVNLNMEDGSVKTFKAIKK
ncbi:T9SS type A sorting domain-containing protein [Epilithonimonas sp. JDS]|uniref:GEVED domain-containing protein n=1 Tax=Epilithonimonas sp. JDS TaxID=2902797 RepID=UPI001E3324E5|nr:GEVED domain-containing protein [Epilithonimonas sp. JDS]MCD9856366.1 T9SS type A sorting domain-containing protein [Epilithonimonas sp. JDS]